MVGSLRHMVSRARLAFGASVAVAAFGAAMAQAASASAAQAPEWKITSYAMPTDLPPGGSGEVLVTAVNVGGAATNGGTIGIEDVLPAELEATGIVGEDRYPSGPIIRDSRGRVKMSCAPLPALSCTSTAAVLPGDQLVLVINVKVKAGAPASVVNRANVSGGGAGEAAVSSPMTVSSQPAEYGLVPGSAFAAVSSHSAGAHADVTTGFALNTVIGLEALLFFPAQLPVADPKNVAFELPPGAVGNTVGIPRCTSTLATRHDCPADTIVGVATTTYHAAGREPLSYVAAVYNVAPAPGEPAAFVFMVGPATVRLDTSVLSDGNDAVRVTASDLSESGPALASYVTVWGVPADHQGPGAIRVADEVAGVTSVGSPSTAASRVPLLSNPTQCAVPLTGAVESDSWRNPGVFSHEQFNMGTLSGCLKVPFESSFTLLPDTLEAGAPAGYHFDLRVNQHNDPDQPSTSDVRSVSLSLPEGVVVNPSAAWGLKACSEEQFYGTEHPSQQPAPVAKCPREAQVGTVSVHTPALEEALEGQVYLAEPACQPCTPEQAENGEMVRLYVQLTSEGEGGIVVKLEGHGEVNRATGQITTVFEENPQLPFSEFKLKLTGGPRAVLANPRTCGTVKAQGDLGPWSSLLAENEPGQVGDSQPYYEFEINQNCHGPEFHPSFKAGMPNVEAGEYGEFTLAFGRPDNSEFLSTISTHTPNGLMGSLQGIPLCPQSAANVGTCSSASQIGEVEVLTGPGANPFLVAGGQVYLTEGYGGAPFGLSIVVPAKAGPYTLGGLNGDGSAADDGKVVVRAQIYVDPHTAQLTVTSGKMPSMLDGIPLQLKAVNVRINRPKFTFNPTNCNKMAITGILDAVEGMSASVESPFQVTNCARMSFKPEFSASTSGKTSRADGASLKVRLAYPNAPFGTQANIKSVRVDLPKALPSRLTTLNHACPDSTFNQNPASCPAQSKVGYAKATTSILPVPVEGPAYFVSHGGQKFPELVMVLQGYGVTIELNGETFINEAGITSSTFKAVPDVPVGSFELNLPEGPFSAVAANRNLCRTSLVMPTSFTAQNGATLTQSTPVEVEGCPNALSVLTRKVNKQTLTVEVAVPRAGRLAATGRGLTSASKTANGRATLTLKLKERHAGALRTKVLLRFTPTAGKQRKILRDSIAVTFH